MDLYRKGTQELAGNLRSWRGCVILRVQPDSDESSVVWIDSVVAKTPRSGHGTQAMEWLTDLADQTGVTLRLDAVPIGNQKMPEKSLLKFYRGFGFKSKSEPSAMERKSLAAVVRYPVLYRALKQGLGDVVDPRYPSEAFDLPDFNEIWSPDYKGPGG